MAGILVQTTRFWVQPVQKANLAKMEPVQVWADKNENLAYAGISPRTFIPLWWVGGGVWGSVVLV